MGNVLCCVLRLGMGLGMGMGMGIGLGLGLGLGMGLGGHQLFAVIFCAFVTYPQYSFR